MHPSDDILTRYALLGADAGSRLPDVAAHLPECVACRTRLERLEAWLAATDASISQGLPPGAQELAAHLQKQAQIAARTIQLQAMPIDSPGTPVHLAADGRTEPPTHTGLEHRATLYAENPELVLRLMRDPRTRKETLHLIGADPVHSSNVLIHIEEPSMDFLTDAAGVAPVGDATIENPSALKWQVRLPDATFSLSPLEHVPEETSPAPEFEITSAADDRIGVSLTSREGAMDLRLRLIQIGGRENLDRVRLVISQEPSPSRILEMRAAEPCVVSGLLASVPIDIRIFAT